MWPIFGEEGWRARRLAEPEHDWNSDPDKTGQILLEGILGGVRAGVVVLDGNLRVEAWNEAATDLWGLRSEEVVGSPFLNLDIGLPVEKLKQPLLAALAGTDEQEVTLEATNRRGRPIRCRVACTSLHGGEPGLRGFILLMEEIRSEEFA